MSLVTYSMGVSLDGYAIDPASSFAAPDPDLFRHITEQTRELSAYVLGRRLYETMLYWETTDAHEAHDDDDARVWAAIWKALPKVVFSSTLTEVQGNARLATGGLAAELERLRAAPGDGDIAIGGPTLAAEAARLGLIDEYQPRVTPVIVGGGTPFYPRDVSPVELELTDRRTFGGPTTVYRYRVRR